MAKQVQNVLGEFVIGLIPLTPGKIEPHEYVLKKPNSGLVEAIKLGFAQCDAAYTIDDAKGNYEHLERLSQQRDEDIVELGLGSHRHVQQHVGQKVDEPPAGQRPGEYGVNADGRQRDLAYNAAKVERAGQGHPNQRAGEQTQGPHGGLDDIFVYFAVKSPDNAPQDRPHQGPNDEVGEDPEKDE